MDSKVSRPPLPLRRAPEGPPRLHPGEPRRLLPPSAGRCPARSGARYKAPPGRGRLSDSGSAPHPGRFLLLLLLLGRGRAASAMAQGGDDAKAAVSPEGGGGGDGPLPGLWLAVLVALVAAALAWLRYGGEKTEEARTAAAAAGESAPPQAPRPEEPLQGSHNCPASETKPNDVSVCQEPAWNLLVSPGEHSIPRETPEIEPIVKDPVTLLMNCKEYPRNDIFDFPATASVAPKREDNETHGTGASAEAGDPSNMHESKGREPLQHNSLDPEEWEMVPEHSAGGDATGSIVEEAGCSRDLEQAKRVAAVSPMPQTVHVTFRVHYITYSETQLIAVTGDHECLGQWHHYVPLRCEKDGFWSDSVPLPVDTRVEWKFIVVENEKVRRWEECDNRTLMTEHEDRVVHKWWGHH